MAQVNGLVVDLVSNLAGLVVTRMSARVTLTTKSAFGTIRRLPSTRLSVVHEMVAVSFRPTGKHTFLHPTGTIRAESSTAFQVATAAAKERDTGSFTPAVVGLE